jgi:hypothetical protein
VKKILVTVGYRELPWVTGNVKVDWDCVGEIEPRGWQRLTNSKPRINIDEHGCWNSLRANEVNEVEKTRIARICTNWEELPALKALCRAAEI